MKGKSAVVVGASMSGLLAARALSEHFERVTVVEHMKRFPSGYLVVGDGGLSQRFYARARKIVDIPWTIATGEDLRFPRVEGARPPGFRIVNRYLERAHAVASEDEFVCRKFFDVLNLLAPPPSLMSPAVAWRVLARRAPTGESSPWGQRRRRSA